MIVESSLVHSPLGQSGGNDALSVGLKRGGKLHTQCHSDLSFTQCNMCYQPNQKLWSALLRFCALCVLFIESVDYPSWGNKRNTNQLGYLPRHYQDV